MSSEPIGRRAFLGASGGVLLAGALGSRSALAAIGARNTALSPLVLSSDLFAAPYPQRFVFAIAKGPKYASFDKAQVAFAPPEGTKGTLIETRLYKKGLPKGRGVYVVDAVFDVPGVWHALVVTSGRQTRFVVQVNAQPVAPIAGMPAPRAASPTKADPLGVDPICTRVPACGLHKVSLSTLIGAGTPVAVMFATPALCQSMYCGPVLDELLSVKDRYAGTMKFVHVEIYRSNKGADLSPTVEAWRIQTEPWLYTVDGDGTIVGRIDGAFGRDEIVSQLDALAAH
jgi:hypothetical protein